MKEVSAGGVVYSRDGGEPRILLILDMYGEWTLPKGHVDPGETPQEAALREIMEEVGLRGEIEHDLGKIHYQYSRDLRTFDKTVYYYLVRAVGTKVRIAPREVQAARWVPLEQVLELSGYADNVPVLEKAIAVLKTQAAATP